ncbi:MAG TPA: ATP-binding cassette domain-containing protein [Myxococcota bacterium]|jgi:phospholipid/cholesterol/gamma-HCH transport system ATP-binding protein|nr:ATP-binding cassette domain-containing protein [Myxococcota bacterium]
MIAVEGVSIGYGETAILERLDFSVSDGEVFAILGGSGSGKSTLLRNLIGLDVPLAGRVLVDGAPPAQELGPPRFGVLFQSGALFGSMTLAENVALPLRKWTDLDARAIDVVVRAKLRLVGLEGFENHLPAEVSGGMKKRAGIARALALDPPLLFLDEPSAGLDPVRSAELDELILTLNRSLGVTTVLVTHELASIFAVACRCILVDRDAHGIIASGSPRELRDASSDPRVRAFFHRGPA